ncbi:hypothetical protein JQ604_33625 [Bradyrhizobium jicamae]|uniref:hypothetical protein n=1 Tax=Bradyrhizobium jicamae TaxID=280332 RepID=UPI001BAC7639|nr:hypothetical protein [Bradyrhizobium jicamae]MBR0757149.1 hypothetical protein [Bradyrhizobium jicamae]
MPNNTALKIRNPFGTIDVPEPDDHDVMHYAERATLSGDGGDGNAAAWAPIPEAANLDGAWASRWNGGADPTIPGDAPDKWKQGRAEIRVVGDRVYLRFDWDGGRRHGLIDAAREGTNRLVGKYINLTDPGITRPWIGLIVDATRIDGCFPEGRLDFRR